MEQLLLEHIRLAKRNQRKLLAILLDPDKLPVEEIKQKVALINQQKVDFVFVGGSTVRNGQTALCVQEIKKHTTIPVILFPGSHTQLTNKADAVLMLSLLSGRNPEYLIEQHIKAVPFLKNSTLEILPTGYILINGGKETAVQKVSNTQPIDQANIDLIRDTALAAQFNGKSLVYLEAGSGANFPIASEIIKEVSENLEIPLIVGGGIRSQEQLELAYSNGADIVVIGTAFEQNQEVLNTFKTHTFK